jgi:hypothetical protein
MLHESGLPEEVESSMNVVFTISLVLTVAAAGVVCGLALRLLKERRKKE